MMRQLLVFPVSVVVLAFVSFVFGGRCDAWQWWLAAVFAIAAGFWRRPVREGIRTGLSFIAWMAIAWIGCGVIAGAAWTDEVTYHYPAVRMLAGGWNPLRDCTPAAALASSGLLQGECWIDHIVFMPKIVWVFDAEAWFFTGDVFNPLAPILWFLFPADGISQSGRCAFHMETACRADSLLHCSQYCAYSGLRGGVVGCRAFTFVRGNFVKARI